MSNFPGWLDEKGRSSHDRLDIFGKLWNEHITKQKEWQDAAIATLGEYKAWATGADEKITSLLNSLIPDVAQADEIVAAMLEVETTQGKNSATMGQLQEEMATTRSDIVDAKRDMKQIESTAMMLADGGNADKRKAAAAELLKENEEYQEIKAALAINERGRLVKQSFFDTAEREYKRTTEQLKSLRARLQHWTARAQLSIGE